MSHKQLKEVAEQVGIKNADKKDEKTLRKEILALAEEGESESSDEEEDEKDEEEDEEEKEKPAKKSSKKEDKEEEQEIVNTKPIEKGQEVMGLWDEGDEAFRKGIAEKVKGDKITVKFDNGKEKELPLSKVFPYHKPKSLKKGDKIFGEGSDEVWYLAEVVSEPKGDKVEIMWDGGRRPTKWDIDSVVKR
jgi:hypothetical protein